MLAGPRLGGPRLREAPLGPPVKPLGFLAGMGGWGPLFFAWADSFPKGGCLGMPALAAMRGVGTYLAFFVPRSPLMGPLIGGGLAGGPATLGLGTVPTPLGPP